MTTLHDRFSKQSGHQKKIHYLIKPKTLARCIRSPWHGMAELSLTHLGRLTRNLRDPQRWLSVLMSLLTAVFCLRSLISLLDSSFLLAPHPLLLTALIRCKLRLLLLLLLLCSQLRLRLVALRGPRLRWRMVMTPMTRVTSPWFRRPVWLVIT